MQRRHHLRALADRRGDPLDRTRRGRRRWRTRPAGWFPASWRSPPASAPVSTKPLASSATPDPASQSVFGSAPMKRNRWRIGRRISSPDAPCRQRTASSMPSAPSSALICVRVTHLDIGQSGDAVDQIARHACRQVRAAHEQPDLGDLARQIDHRLARRIAGADQGDLLPGAKLRLQRRCPIMHARRLRMPPDPSPRAADSERRWRSRPSGRLTRSLSARFKMK